MSALAHSNESSNNPTQGHTGTPQLATANQRVYAYLLDLIFLMAGGGICGAVGAALLHDATEYIGGIAGGAIWFVNFILLLYSSGQSLGKKIIGIAIVDKNYADIGILGLLLRETIGRWFEAVTLYLGTLGVVKQSERRTLHDMVGGTVVISLPRRPRMAGENNSASAYFIACVFGFAAPAVGILAAIAIPNFFRF